MKKIIFKMIMSYKWLPKIKSENNRQKWEEKKTWEIKLMDQICLGDSWGLYLNVQKISLQFDWSGFI